MNNNESKGDAPGQNKEFTVYVNTREVTVSGKEISFREVVALAYPNPVFSEQINYTVSYSKGHEDNMKGTMVDGGKNVRLKEKMVFDVEKADRS